MVRAALKVVDSPPFYSEGISLEGGNLSGEVHSLHQVASLPYMTRPAVATYCIERFSRPGDVVFDPFCGTGTIPLEANLLGRVAYASDRNPLSVRMTQAKLDPADLTEVTMALQQLDFRRPVNLKSFCEYFAPFYDVATFRELANLKLFLERNTDRAACFLELLALGLLHGPSAGYFSAYSPSQISLSPMEQEELNVKRRQVPDYRSVTPRLLKRSASSLRDGYVSSIRNVALRNISGLSDARNVPFIPPASVDLVVTTPPVPGEEQAIAKQWLKLWFAGYSAPQLSREISVGTTPNQWGDFMNEVLVELARVVRTSGRVVLNLCDIPWRGGRVALDDIIYQMVETHLHRFWEPECLLVDEGVTDKVAGRKRRTGSGRVSVGSRILVLRRF
ncbi:MAG: hypothetical protein KDD55_02870 [Bdellovibrionales bacterium]|nr:hypothetical protein [Bdellovibrionales bacterium]